MHSALLIEGIQKPEACGPGSGLRLPRGRGSGHWSFTLSTQLLRSGLTFPGQGWVSRCPAWWRQRSKDHLDCAKKGDWRRLSGQRNLMIPWERGHDDLFVNEARTKFGDHLKGSWRKEMGVLQSLCSLDFLLLILEVLYTFRILTLCLLLCEKRLFTWLTVSFAVQTFQLS